MSWCSQSVDRDARKMIFIVNQAEPFDEKKSANAIYASFRAVHGRVKDNA